MADLDDLLDLIPIGDIAKQLGVSEDAAAAAVQQVVPTMVSGLQANVASGGSSSLEAALGKHAGNLPGGRVSLDSIDTTDGEKIVRNIFGGSTEQVTEAVASNSAADVTKDLVAKVLPIIAPIVLGWLASKFLGGSNDASASTQQDSSGGLGDLVGDLLGGGSNASSSGGGIGDLLGGLLGGGGSVAGAGSGDLGSVLGGLLGGGRR